MAGEPCAGQLMNSRRADARPEANGELPPMRTSAGGRHPHLSALSSRPADCMRARGVQLPIIPEMLLAVLLVMTSSAASAAGATAAEASVAAILLDWRSQLLTAPLKSCALDTWTESSPMCDWAGIDCDSVGQVTSITVAECSLSGPLPVGFSGLSSLSTLNLTTNLLTGALPVAWSTAMGLKTLDVSSNSITGGLPAQYHTLQNLEVVNISSNRVTGSLPPSWSRLRALQILDLSTNLLEGMLLPEYSALTSLKSVQLSQNDLSGTIPEEWMLLKDTICLRLDANHLEGLIPEGIALLQNLEDLNLSNNQITGTLPESLGLLLSLKMLRLRNAQLSGTIPPHLGQLGLLSVLELDSNFLQGSLPSELSQLTAMESLSLCSTSDGFCNPPGNCRPDTYNAFCNDNIPIPLPTSDGMAELFLECVYPEESDPCTQQVLNGPEVQDSSDPDDGTVVVTLVAMLVSIIGVLLFIVVLLSYINHRQQKAAVSNQSNHTRSTFTNVANSSGHTSRAAAGTSRGKYSIPLYMDHDQQVSLAEQIIKDRRRMQESALQKSGEDLQELLTLCASHMGTTGTEQSIWRRPSKSMPSNFYVEQTGTSDVLFGVFDSMRCFVPGHNIRLGWGNCVLSRAASFSHPKEAIQHVSRSSRHQDCPPLRHLALGLQNRQDINMDLNFERDIKPHLTLLLGEGAFGAVYLGVYQGRKAAVKLFGQSLRGVSEGRYQSFLREVHTLSQLQDCPQIVRMYGASLRRCSCCIVYEWMPTSLHKRLYSHSEPPLCYLEVLRIVHDIATGLERMHPGVIHRDLKPENVMLDADNRAKLIDFGISRLKSQFESGVVTEAGGTPAYMAPEVFDGRNKITEKSDVYSLGCIMCEMMARKPIFPQYNVPAQVIVAVAVRKERPQLPNGCPILMAQLIRSCWHEDPQRRPTCEQVLRKLEFMLLSELQGGAVTAMPEAEAVPGVRSQATDAEAHEVSPAAIGKPGCVSGACSPPELTGCEWSPALSFDGNWPNVAWEGVYSGCCGGALTRIDSHRIDTA